MTAVMMVLCVAAFAQDGKSIYNKYSDKENVSADQLYVLIDRMSAEKMVKSGKYELLMEAKDSGEIARIYVVTSADMVLSFVMISSEPGDCTVICIDGKIAKTDIEKLLSAAME